MSNFSENRQISLDTGVDICFYIGEKSKTLPCGMKICGGSETTLGLKPFDIRRVGRREEDV